MSSIEDIGNAAATDGVRCPTVLGTSWRHQVALTKVRENSINNT